MGFIGARGNAHEIFWGKFQASILSVLARFNSIEDIRARGIE